MRQKVVKFYFQFVMDSYLVEFICMKWQTFEVNTLVKQQFFQTFIK